MKGAFNQEQPLHLWFVHAPFHIIKYWRNWNTSFCLWSLSKRLKFLYLCSWESLDLFPYPRFLTVFSGALHCCLVALCASITERHEIILLQLKLLEKPFEEPFSDHLVEMVCPFILFSVHVHTIRQKIFVPRGHMSTVVTFVVIHSFVWVCRNFIMVNGLMSLVSTTVDIDLDKQLEKTSVIHLHDCYSKAIAVDLHGL